MKKKNNNKITGIILGVVIGFINGFFGGGAGMLVVPSLIHFYAMKDKQAHATSLLVIFPLSIISSIVYLIKSGIKVVLCLKVGIGFVIGGVIGALLLKKTNNKILRFVFSIIMVACGIIQIFK